MGSGAGGWEGERWKLEWERREEETREAEADRAKGRTRVEVVQNS